MTLETLEHRLGFPNASEILPVPNSSLIIQFVRYFSLHGDEQIGPIGEKNLDELAQVAPYWARRLQVSQRLVVQAVMNGTQMKLQSVTQRSQEYVLPFIKKPLEALQLWSPDAAVTVEQLMLAQTVTYGNQEQFLTIVPKGEGFLEGLIRDSSGFIEFLQVTQQPKGIAVVDGERVEIAGKASRLGTYYLDAHIVSEDEIPDIMKEDLRANPRAICLKTRNGDYVLESGADIQARLISFAATD